MISGADIKIPRSAIMQFVPKDTSWKHGQLVPLDSFLVDPGTTIKCNFDGRIIMNTPIHAFSTPIEFQCDAYYIPMRLLWTKWKQLFGENENSAGVPSDPDLKGYFTQYSSGNIHCDGIDWDSLSAYLGKPIVSQNLSLVNFATLWKEKAYYKVWSDFYRAAMVQPPYIMNDTPSAIGSLRGTPLSTKSKLLQVNKVMDYFTAGLQSPQFGTAVTLPLGDTAPIKLKIPTGSSAVAYDPITINGTSNGLSANTDAVNVYADLSTATAATINSIRYAFAVQKYQELGNYAGPYYWSQLKAHYGVTPSDASLQRPQRLGTINFKVNVSQVTAMANTTVDGTVSPAGSVAAVSVTGHSGHLFTKAFDEHGVVLLLGFTRVCYHTYVDGILEEDTRFKRTDFYSNEFANIGEQPIYKREIKVTGTSVDDEVWAYQEAWSSSRYRFSKPSGICNPAAGSGVADPTWNLAESFATTPTLGDVFLQEDRNVVASRLFGQSSTHDFVGQFEFTYDKISEIPLHSVPGRLDHVGNM